MRLFAASAPAPAGDPSLPFGVVDIGSNSVRLVVFERVSRNPWQRFNEKVICGIGRSLLSSGRLHQEGSERALAALGRFRTLASGMGVASLHVVATAAVRDASDGAAFVEDAAARIGQPIRVLTGEDEARLSALGVLSGIPSADGLVGDLGGGSLEITELNNGKLGRAATFPIGPLRLMDAAKGKVKAASDIAETAFSELDWLREIKGRRLYMVGGIWRNFSAIMMSQSAHSIRILQHYTAPTREVKTMAQALAGLSRKSLEQIPELPVRRIEAMPFGAAVLLQLIKATEVEDVVTSAYGVREGVLYDALSPAQVTSDPLLEAAADLNLRQSRAPGHAPELLRWLAPLVEAWPSSIRRLVEAASYISDTGWRAHPDYRAKQLFDRVLTMPVAGISHEDRAFLALSIYERYGGNSDSGGTKWAFRFLSEDDQQRARVLGRALRLAYNLSGAVAGLLPLTLLTLDDEHLTLQVNRARGPLLGEAAKKRLATLANVLGLKDRVTFE